MATQAVGTAPTAPHHVRTFFAAVFGIVAFVLILVSILVVWLNRTLLDTTTFVNTLSPVVQQVDVQNFIADKLAEQLLESAPTQDVAGMLLTESERAGKTEDQLKAALNPVIQGSLLQVVQVSACTAPSLTVKAMRLACFSQAESSMSSFDDYFSTISPADRTEFERIRSIIREMVPSVEEGTSYGMPAYMYKGKGVVSTMVTKKFLSLYPFSGKIGDKLGDKLKGFETTPGSIHFSVEHPLSEALLREIVALRLEEIDSKTPTKR